MTDRLIDLILGPAAPVAGPSGPVIRAIDPISGPESPTASPAALLPSTCLPTGARRLTIAGLAKNVGKTVTLNHVIAGASSRGVRLGLTSTGRDGEKRDAITELPKPAIHAPEGSYVATALEALSESSASIEIVGNTEFHTPFGPIILGRVTEPGTVLLIGPGSSQRISAVLDRLETLGAGLCLVDGSLDRLAAAAPGVTGTLILATGAAYSPSMKATVARTAQAIDVFGLPGAGTETESENLRNREGQPGVSLVIESSLGRAAAIVASLVGDRILPKAGVPSRECPGDQTFPEDHVEGSSRDRSGDRPAIERILLKGALTTSLVAEILRIGITRDIELIVEDATRVIVDGSVWRRFRRRGGRVSVLRPIRLLAVTCNPWSPSGPGYPQPEFIDEVYRLAGGLPVFDLVAGLGRPDSSRQQ